MSDRIFVDRTGAQWTVSEIAAAPPSLEPRERRASPRSKTRIAIAKEQLSTRPLALSALIFTRTNERRRLTPAPAGWHSLPDDELEDLLHRTILDPSR